jgi:hypothetical protein
MYRSNDRLQDSTSGRRRSRRTWVIGVTILLLTAACTSDGDDAPPRPPNTPRSTQVPASPEGTAEGQATPIDPMPRDSVQPPPVDQSSSDMNGKGNSWAGSGGSAGGSGDATGRGGGSGSGSGGGSGSGSGGGRGSGSGGGGGSSSGSGGGGGGGSGGGGGVPTTGYLSRSDPVPAGVAAQLEFFGGGGDDCSDVSPVGSTLEIQIDGRFDQDYLSEPDSYPLCVFNFSTQSALRIQAISPLGQVVSDETIKPGKFHSDFQESVIFRRLIGDPVGIYTLLVTQGFEQGSMQLQVKAALSPQLAPVANDAAGNEMPFFTDPLRLGTTVNIAFGGFRPRSTVQFHVYGKLRETSDAAPTVSYLTSISVKIPDSGGGLFKLRTYRDDPSSCYLVTSELVVRDEAPINFCLVK